MEIARKDNDSLFSSLFLLPAPNEPASSSEKIVDITTYLAINEDSATYIGQSRYFRSRSFVRFVRSIRGAISSRRRRRVHDGESSSDIQIFFGGRE